MNGSIITTKLFYSLITIEAGQKAAKEAASVLTTWDKTFIGFLDDYKDASDALQAGDTEAVRAVM